ncbi:MAG: aromatic acid exporter family protein [Eubacteriales bacterium]|nr:aromatic acid exporter family protein [Eubacteriales bacterium]
MNLPHIGFRNLKTAFAAALCALLYAITDRNPTFACIGAIFGMGTDMDNSKLHGGNRLFGTIIGGLLGIVLFWVYLQFYPEAGHSFFLVVLLFIGVIILILLSQYFWVGAVQPGGVVLCIILFNTPVETYVSYSINRIIDTGIGVLVALLINYLLPRHRLVAWKNKILGIVKAK